MQNKNGKLVKASPESVSAAGAAGVSASVQAGGGMVSNIWDQPGDDVYPISSFTYLIIYKDLSYVKDQAKANTLVDFFRWCTTDGQKAAAAKGYAPLDVELQKKVGDLLGTLTFNGQPIKM